MELILHFSQVHSLPTDLAELTNSCDWLRSALYSPFVSDTSRVCEIVTLVSFSVIWWGTFICRCRFMELRLLWFLLTLFFLLWSVHSSNYYERRWLCYVSLPIQIMFPCFPVLPFPPMQIWSCIFQSCDFHPCILVPCFPVLSFPPLQFGPRFSSTEFSIPAFSVAPITLHLNTALYVTNNSAIHSLYL